MTNETDIGIGQRVRAFRRASGISQAELGKHLGVTFQQIQKYERGANRISTGRLVDIAKALNIPVKDFFDDEVWNSGKHISELVYKIMTTANNCTAKQQKALLAVADGFIGRE